MSVYVFDGDKYSGTTDDAGQVIFTLPVGAYRFRADYDGVPFWSGMESTSFYLYGRGVIGTKTDSWSYILQDGLGSTCQLATHEGVILMSVAYTPWGDVLAYYGSGGIDFGYLGGMYDDATGLIYLGSGKYYDPVTGRMLTRGAGQSNPYRPGAFDPAGMMVAPLAMLGLVLGKKKKRGKWDTFIALLVVCVVVGMSVSACTRPSKDVKIEILVAEGMATSIAETTVARIVNEQLEIIVSATKDASLAQTAGAPASLPTPTCPPTPTIEPTVMSTPTPSVPTRTVFEGLSVDFVYTGITPQQLYEHYIKLWEKQDGWWWKYYGDDADGFSFWDYVAIYMNHEAMYTHVEFIPNMAEAGIRFWKQRVKEGLVTDDEENSFVEWWASFSQSNAHDVKNDRDPVSNATIHQYQEFRAMADKFKNPPNNWNGLELARPYNWGNLSAIRIQSPNSHVGEMLAANAKRSPIIFHYIPGNDPFYIPSGCAQVNWMDGKDEYPSAKNPNVCDYLLNPQ